MSNICKNCGKSVEGKHKFCSNCGTSILDNPNDNMIICEVCGNENTIGVSFCTECGGKINSGNAKQEVNNKHSEKKHNEKNVNIPSHKGKNEKTLSKGTLLSIFFGAFAIIIIMLIAEGVFDQNKTVVQKKINTNTPQININNINQINNLEAQVKANPNNMELLLQLANLRDDSGFYEQAIANYKTYLKNRPNDVDARVDLGVCYYNIKEYETAIAEMEKAIKINPKHQIGLLNLGVVNLTAGNFEKSKEWLQKAISVNPNSDVGKRAKELLNLHIKK